MSPTPFHDHPHIKRDTNGLYNSPLKISKDSHFIKKSPPSSSSSSSSSLINAAPKPQQRHPVIIYTHSPRVIHTHPRDFMALVQKLTGLSRSEDDNQTAAPPRPPKSDQGHNKNNSTTPNKNTLTNTCDDEDNKNTKRVVNDDNESTSVITDENGGSSVGDGQVNSCFVPPTIFDHPPNPCFNNIPFFTPNSTDFLCSTTAQPFFHNYTDSMFFMPNTTAARTSVSSSTLDGMKEFREY